MIEKFDDIKKEIGQERFVVALGKVSEKIIESKGIGYTAPELRYVIDNFPDVFRVYQSFVMYGINQ